MNPRPSHKELSKKLRQAIELVTEGKVSILEPNVILADSMELGYSFKLEFYPIIQELLNLAAPENYAGARPPQQSYEAEIKGADLYAFVIESSQLNGINIYFKFALYNDALVIVSLHEDRKEGNHG
jgi:hypothetical protein